VRAAGPGDIAAVKHLLEGQTAALLPSASSVTPWLAHRVHGQDVNHCYVLVDQRGGVLATLGLHDDSIISEMVVTRMPRSVAMANRLVHAVGPDGRMRTAQVAFRACSTPETGRYLWSHVRWCWRERVTSIVTTVDPTDPGRGMLAAPRWLPATTITLAVRMPDPHLLTGPIQLPL
jgi:hypothetical protein